MNYGKWFDYMLEWEKVFKKYPELPVLLIKYEDIKKVTDNYYFSSSLIYVALYR